MGKKLKFSVREKEKIVLRFLKNEISANYICEYFKVNRYVLNKYEISIDTVLYKFL